MRNMLFFSSFILSRSTRQINTRSCFFVKPAVFRLMALICLFNLQIISTFAFTLDEILDRMEANDKMESAKMTLVQNAYQADGDVNRSELISYSKDEGEKGLMEYALPNRIKGMKILTLNDGDDIWFFSPRTGRARKIASHQRKQSVNDSDFSYEDLSTRDFRKDYTITQNPDEKLNERLYYVITMVPKDKGKSYSKIILWVDQTNFVAVKGLYYDEDGELWKESAMEDIKKVGNYWVAHKMVMKNLIKGSHTEMLVKTVECDLSLPDNYFSEQYLKR